MTRGDQRALVRVVATALGLEFVARLDGGLIGASLVERPDGRQLVLKVGPDPGLAPVWAVGAATATALGGEDYPAARYVGTGSIEGAVWSLQEVLPGRVPRTLTADLARQLVDLARAHDVELVDRRDWRSDALEAACGWLATIPFSAVAPGFHGALQSALDRTAGAVLLERSVVHSDFHPGNTMIEHGRVAGVFDWEIASPGDWRFDLVHLMFWCRVLPAMAEPGAADLVVAAASDHVPHDVAAFMLACQSLRAAAIELAHRADRVAPLSARILDCFGPMLAAQP